MCGNTDHFFGDTRTGNGGTKQITRFVNGVALDGLEYVIVDELFAEVRDETLAGTAGEGFGLDGGKVFFVLADVGAEGDDVEAFFTEPFEDYAGVEAAGIGEDYFRFGG